MSDKDAQFDVRDSERRQREMGLTDYSDDHVRQAIVHAREDLVMIYAACADSRNLLLGMRRRDWFLIVPLWIVAACVMKWTFL